MTGTEHLPVRMRESQKDTTTGNLAKSELYNYRILRAGNYDRDTRHKMRESLKRAVIKASEIGLASYSLTPESLIWDAKKKKNV